MNQIVFDCYNMQHLFLFAAFKIETSEQWVDSVFFHLPPQGRPADAEFLSNFGLIPSMLYKCSKNMRFF
jgi:hypothetical protein